jgi:hypothetical protein
MSEHEKKIALADIPDPGKIEEHGISIDAPTPTQFVMPDPWTPSNNGSPSPTAADPATRPTDGTGTDTQS